MASPIKEEPNLAVGAWELIRVRYNQQAALRCAWFKADPGAQEAYDVLKNSPYDADFQYTWDGDQPFVPQGVAYGTHLYTYKLYRACFHWFIRREPASEVIGQCTHGPYDYMIQPNAHSDFTLGTCCGTPLHKTTTLVHHNIKGRVITKAAFDRGEY